ncbi:helix-turn-helix transcriptional regulator [Pectobacterium brasiliense]|uniref:Helix-turn-helix transcriptional regulator n=1 Tax=Pectobacterium brasiliense TaxID=180957 RepID=A0AAE2WCD6_9GAMM|nr:AraC family transcriptional regulator [Pectobacterium brasiliense]MBA0215860.1 helix-turn-helix transcriptional regulator [Pectobacterium brasiliense]MBN3050742.1 helix-turn-helix transcriptional regulator [Pectobacterium brasiliense]MBN3072572.1 helix-turn-helix transcriptional regulator [Pectobacterium brasiliense]MBN3168334.1 helix-turn-helix transcriptional regulator [Pectobacterium brasiliense]
MVNAGKLDAVLDEKIREITESEAFYLQNPGALSKKYDRIAKVDIDGKNIYYFELTDLDTHAFEITRNSRFTSVLEHVHSSLHMSYVYSGKSTMSVDGKCISLGENDVCFIDRNVIRSKEFLGENDIIISIHFGHKFLTNNFLKKLTNRSFFSDFIASALSENNDHKSYIFFRSNNNKKIRMLFMQLISECYNKNSYSNEIISCYLSLIMFELIMMYRENPAPHVINIPKEERGDIIDILSYIDDNFITCSLKSLAKEFGYNEKYLSHLIKNKTGLGFKDIQTMKRIKYAAHLLETSALPIRDVSERSGIANENFFYKKFFQEYGKTPKEYRCEFSFEQLIEQKLL